jgi:Holliday junction resolvase RusA-like endonuclease
MQKMTKADPLAAMREALEECGKNLAVAVASYGLARQAFVEHLESEEEVEFTDAYLRIAGNPTRALFIIDGPVPTTNLELKHYLPKDRYVWSTMKAWWRGQIASAIRMAGRCPKFETAAVLVQVGTNADLDNIGLKCAIDALVQNRVIANDKKGVLQFLGVEHVETIKPEIRVCVFHPDQDFTKAVSLIRKRATLEQQFEIPSVPTFGGGESFFDPPEAQA